MKPATVMNQDLQTRMALLARAVLYSHMKTVPASEWLYQHYREHLNFSPTKVLVTLWNEHRQSIADNHSEVPGCLPVESDLAASQISAIRNLLIQHFAEPGELSRLVCAKLRDNREHFEQNWPVWIEQHHTRHLPLLSSVLCRLLGQSLDQSFLDDAFAELSSLLLNGSVLHSPPWQLAMTELALLLNGESPSWIWCCYDLPHLVLAWQSFQGWFQGR